MKCKKCFYFESLCYKNCNSCGNGKNSCGCHEHPKDTEKERDERKCLDDEEQPHGFCYRYPAFVKPDDEDIAMGVNAFGQREHVIVREDDWCGEWRSKKRNKKTR
jgi:hypothetical protein